MLSEATALDKAAITNLTAVWSFSCAEKNANFQRIFHNFRGKDRNRAMCNSTSNFAVWEPQQNSPEWIRLWADKSPCCANDRLHVSQAYGFSPVWVRWWICRRNTREKLRPHLVHWCGFSPVCVLCPAKFGEDIFSSGYTCSTWASFKMCCIVGVIPHVHFQVAAFDETAVTHVALVRLEATVASSVQVKRALRFERFRAGFADKRPLTGVYLSRQQDGICLKNAAPFPNRKENGPLPGHVWSAAIALGMLGHSICICGFFRSFSAVWPTTSFEQSLQWRPTGCLPAS